MDHPLLIQIEYKLLINRKSRAIEKGRSTLKDVLLEEANRYWTLF
jgi:hypothetical protein